MSKYYAAVDMGASSGRLMVGWTENGKMSWKRFIVSRTVW